MEAVSRSILMFYIPMLIVLGLVTYIPALTLWLPNLLLGEMDERARYGLTAPELGYRPRQTPRASNEISPQRARI